MSRRRAFLTVVTQNHLHFAWSLMASIRDAHPDTERFVVLIDRPAEWPDQDGFARYLSPDSFAIPRIRRFLFHYSAFELSCAIKPFAFEHVISLGFSEVVYLDSDICVYSSLDPIFEALKNHQILLTPHVTSPLPKDGLTPSLEDLRKAGTYNAGFLAMGTSDPQHLFLQWWKSLCYTDCIVDIAAGIHVDQGWLDFVPSLFEGVHIVSRPGWNVGYWNCGTDSISRCDQELWRSGNSNLLFFHFSGFDPEIPDVLSKHQNRFSLIDQPHLRQLLEDYSTRLDTFGRQEFEKCCYGYSTLGDGTPIRPVWREVIRTNHPLLADVEDPFETTVNMDLKSRFRRASLSVCEARMDWKIQAEAQLDKLFQLPPILGKIYLWLRRSLLIWLRR
jgi:hypothetical protein